MADNKFKALVGIEFDKGSIDKAIDDLQKQIDKQDAEIDIKIISNIEEFKQRLNSLNNAKITLNKIDTSGLSKSVLNSFKSVKNKVDNLFNVWDMTAFEMGWIKEEDIAELNKTIRSVQVLRSEIEKIHTKDLGLDKIFQNNKDILGSKIGTFVAKNKSEIDAMGINFDELKQKISNTFEPNDLKVYQKEFEKLKAQVVEFKNTHSQDNVISLPNQKEINNRITKLQTQQSKLNDNIGENGSFLTNKFADTEIGNIKQSILDIENIINHLNQGEGIISSKDLVEADNLLQKIQQLNKVVEKKQKEGLQKTYFESDKDKSVASVDRYIKENSKAMLSNSQALVDLRSKMKDATDPTELKILNREFLALKKNIAAAGQNGRTFGDELANDIKKFGTWVLSSTIFMQVANGLRSMVVNVKDIDSAMVSLLKVTDETSKRYSEFLDNASKSAMELGANISDVINATSDFSRLGYGLDDAETLGKVATIYKNIGDGLNIEDATKSIISTMSAFKKTANEALDIVDIFNNIGNKFAIDSKGIGEGLQKSASALAASNNSLEESVALLTAGNTVVQDASIMGTALKTASLRITKTKSELEEMGEATDFAFNNMSEYASLINALTKNQVNIIGDNGEYKNTYEILKEISYVWDDMNNMSKNSLLNSLFGVRQANVGAAILDNFNIAEQVLQEAQNSSGSAMEEQEKQLQSINAKLNQTAAIIQSISDNIMNSGLFKLVIDSLNTILKLVESVTDKAGGLGVLFASVGGYSGAKGLNIKNMFDRDFNWGRLLSENKQKKASKLFNALESKDMEKFNTLLKDSDTITKQYFSNIDLGKASLNGLSKTIALTTIKQTALNIATNAFIGLGIGMAINGVIALFDKLIVSQEELDEQAKESNNSYKQTKQEVENVTKELDKNYARIKELKAQGTLSYTEKSELDKLDSANIKLEKQLQLLKDKKEIDGYKSAIDSGKALNKYIGDSGQEKIYKNNIGNDVAFNIDAIKKENLSGQLAIIEHYDAIVKNTAKDTDEWRNANDKVTQATQNLKDGQAELNQYLIDYADIYKSIKDKSAVSLTSQEKNVISLYERYEDMSKYVDQALDPNQYNAGQMDKIFENNGVEATKQSLIELAKAGRLDDLNISELENLSKAIEDSGLEADESGSKMESFKDEIKALANESPIEIKVEDMTDMTDTTKIFDERKEQLNDLINLVDAMGESYSLTADEARKFANMFPELLAQGEVTADGLIKFNKAYVDDFINGKEAERKVDAQAKIEQLEAAKQVLIGQKAKAEAELKLAEGVANGEIDLEQAKTQMLADAEKQLTQYLIDLGVDEQTAEMVALDVKAGNMEKYNQFVGSVGGDIGRNLANAMATAANSSQLNVASMINNMDALGRQTNKVAQAVANVSSGKATYGGKVSVGGGAKVVANIGSKFSSPKFTAAKTTKISAGEFALENWKKNIQLDISEYTKAIDSIDAQINLLKAQGNQSLEKYRTKAKKQPKKKKSPKNKKEKEFSETFDWLAIAIQRLEEQIEKLDNTASNVYKSWSARNNALKSSMEKVTDEIALQTAAYNVYMAQANSVSLSSNYKKLVREGALDIETITDEKLAKNIKAYQEYYNNAIETSMKVQELDEKLSNMYEQQFDNVVTYWEARIDVIETSISDIEKMIDINEAKGLFSGKSYYEEMMRLENENINHLKKEREDLLKALDAGVKNGSIVEYSESWYDLTSQINEVNSALLDANESLLEFSNELRQLDWDIFDYGQERVESLSDETEFLLTLLEKQKSFDRNGKNTQFADARFEMLGIRYNTYMQQSDKYKKALKELDEQFKNDSLNKDYIERREELLEAQRESILNAENEKEAIIELIEEGYNAQLDALDKIINKRKEDLQLQQDYLKYQKEIAEKTKNIANLEKQLSAYSTDSSEENQKSIQDLKNELKESKDDLQETEYDKYISDQEAMLDTLYTSFEEWISVRLDDVDGLINETIESINENSNKVSETINGIASDVGYELDQPLKDIINANSDNHNNMYDLVTKYDSNFSNKMTAVKTSIDNIYISVSQLVKKSEEEAKRKLEEQKKQQQQNVTSQNKPTGSSSSSSSKPSNSSGSNSKPSGSSGNKKGNFFVRKKFTGNKHSLNINNSIVDRLKYRDFDSSFSHRSSYYKAMGGSGRYSGSSKQNIFMLSWMRNNGFSRTGSLNSMINTANEDGLFLGRKDDVVIAKQDWNTVGKVIDKAKGIGNNKFDNSIGDVYIQMDMSGIKNYDEFVSRLENDNRFIKYIKTSINSSLIGGNSLRKNKYR